MREMCQAIWDRAGIVTTACMYLVVVVDAFIAEESVLAGPAVVVSGAAGAVGAGVIVAEVAAAVESAFVVVVVPLPQDAAKRPNVRANTLNFTNFIISIFRWLCILIRQTGKGNP